MTVPESLEAIVARYERRLARERQARLAAETLAEDHTRELYEQKRQLELIESVNGVANLANEPLVAFHHAMERLTAFMGWSLGHAWIMGPRGRLRSAKVWVDGSCGTFDGFRSESERLRLPVGAGLPGRAAAAREAIWIDLATDAVNFPRCAIAYEFGIRSGLAFPVRVGDEVVAVLEFFSGRLIQPSPALLRVLEGVGVQLGRVVERHRAERALAKQNRILTRLALEAAAQARAAEAASRAKSAFLAVTSHEIRTPLNAVLGLARVLSTQVAAPDHREMTRGIVESGEMLVRLLSAVLDFSRIEAGAVVAQSQAYSLADLTRRAANLWSPRCAESGVSLVLDQSGFLASGLQLGDPDKVEQTLVNLLSNALKFTPAGDEIRIRLSGPDTDGACRLEVSDGGPGVAASDRERVFIAYEQTEDGRKAGGAGLGLAICAGNIEALGGQIMTDRDETDRSRFWFSFPAPPAEAPAPAAAEPETPTVANRIRILAAEDNAANRRVLQLLLDQVGVDLTCVEDGDAALRAVQAQSFDLVLMDANMPIMNGPEAVRAIRALGGALADLPIQMLTANVFEDDIRAYVEAGANGVLSKPIEIPSLYAAIAAAGGARDQREAA